MQINNGHCRQLGATIEGSGVNFALWARLACSVELLLFSSADDVEPMIIQLNPKVNRTAYYWHIWIDGIGDGQLYGFRVNGPWRPYEGTRFDPQKVLIDPYGLLIDFPSNYRRFAASRKGSNLHCCAKSVVVDTRHYDWENDQPPNHPLSRSVIYELHVGGFTKHPSAGLSAELRGTYTGLLDKIPYLKALGITTIELLPVFQFDLQECAPGNSNYWGYSPMSFFALHRQYASDQSRTGAIREFRDMVKALHREGIEVILDVVYNHTSEGDGDGPTFSWRGFDHEAYYILDPRTHHNLNYSGCGNTVNGSHPVTRRMIVDSLHYWRDVMHVDGFRFDLASILSRDEEGNPLVNPPTLLAIDTDPVLANCKMIAEAWDAGGLYQVGSLAGSRWREWNGQFRDDIRRFIKGDPGTINLFADRFIGSPNIYNYHYADPEKSINFVTCHDGFTLWDLVSYNQKHNEANGEDNRDGSDDNHSWNHGVEGETDDPVINALRIRQAKNFLTCNLLSIGTPMLSMGDELLRTQRGNNNAYGQDNDITWMNWTTTKQNHDMHRYMQQLLKYRRYIFNREKDNGGMFSLADMLRRSEIRWHGLKPYEPDWNPHSHALAFSAIPLEVNIAIYIIFNTYWEPLTFELPYPPHNIEGCWHRILDTAQISPHDIVDFGELLPAVDCQQYVTQSRSVCLFVCGDFAGIRHDPD
jgi:glycogen debranching enzyme GlgX